MKLKLSHSHWVSEVGFFLYIHVCTGHDDTGYLPESEEHSVMSFVIHTQCYFITQIRKKKSMEDSL